MRRSGSMRQSIQPHHSCNSGKLSGQRAATRSRWWWATCSARPPSSSSATTPSATRTIGRRQRASRAARRMKPVSCTGSSMRIVTSPGLSAASMGSPEAGSESRSESSCASANSRRSRSSTWAIGLRCESTWRGPNKCLSKRSTSVGSGTSSAPPSSLNGLLSASWLDSEPNPLSGTVAAQAGDCQSGATSRSRSNRPSSALKTSLQRPHRTQPSETFNWSCTTRKTVPQALQRVARLMRR